MSGPSMAEQLRFLSADLETRTRERDEAVKSAQRYSDAARSHAAGHAAAIARGKDAEAEVELLKGAVGRQHERIRQLREALRAARSLVAANYAHDDPVLKQIDAALADQEGDA